MCWVQAPRTHADRPQVKHVFDLRSKPEVEKGWAGITGEESKGVEDAMKGWEDALRSAGVERSWVPVFAADDYSPERLAERYMVRE